MDNLLKSNDLDFNILPEDKTPTKRQIMAQETKLKIFHAALDEINEKGFNSVAIEDITNAAGVAKGSFYTHFDSKESLVLYTYILSDEIYDKVYEKVKKYDFQKQVEKFFQMSYAQYESRGKGIIKALIMNYYYSPDFNAYSPERSIYKCLDRIVTSGKIEGMLEEKIKNDTYIHALLSTAIGVEVLWCFDEGDRKLSDMMSDAIKITAKGMLK